MNIDKLSKYMIYLLIVFAASIYFGAYVMSAVCFFVLVAFKSKEMLELIKSESALLIFLAAVLLSCIFAKSASFSLLAFGVLLLNAMAFVVMLAFIKRENIENIMSLLNNMAIIICLFGIYQYITGDLFIEKSWTDQSIFGKLVRIYSTLRNPNIFAAYLCFNLSFAVPSFIKKKGDMYTAINIILSSACLILTYSRGGFLAFLAAMLVIIVIYRDIKVGAYMLLMCLLYYAYNSIGIANRATLDILVTDSSSLYRIEIWKQSMILFKKNILFGSGLGGVFKYLSNSSDKLNGFIAHSHNIYIQILAETGVLGFGAFITLVANFIKKFYSFKAGSEGCKLEYIAVGYTASMAAFLVHGLLDCTAFVPTRSLIFVIYFSLFPALYRKIYKESSDTIC